MDTARLRRYCLPLLGYNLFPGHKPAARSFCVTRSLSAYYLACYPTCCHRLVHLLPPLALRKPGQRSGRFGSHPGVKTGAISLWPAWSLSRVRSRLVSHGQEPFGVSPKGATWGDAHHLCAPEFSWTSFAFWMEPPGPDTHPLLLLASTQTMLATNVTQDSTLSPNEFALYLRALLWPSLALSPSKFAANLKITRFLFLYSFVIRGIYSPYKIYIVWLLCDLCLFLTHWFFGVTRVLTLFSCKCGRFERPEIVFWDFFGLTNFSEKKDIFFPSVFIYNWVAVSRPPATICVRIAHTRAHRDSQ